MNFTRTLVYDVSESRNVPIVIAESGVQADAQVESGVLVADLSPGNYYIVEPALSITPLMVQQESTSDCDGLEFGPAMVIEASLPPEDLLRQLLGTSLPDAVCRSVMFHLGLKVSVIPVWDRRSGAAG